MRFKNKYYLLRHGEAISNTKNIISCWPEKFSVPLTEEGKEQIKKAAVKLKKKKIDLIFSSDLLRTKQTAKIVSKELEIPVKYDKRLREYNAGIFNGGPIEELKNFFKTEEERLVKKPPKGETYQEIVKRVTNFLNEMKEKYSSKNILVVSHQVPLTWLEGKTRGLSDKEVFKKFPKERRIKKGEIRKL